MNLKYVGLIVFEKPWVYFDIFYIVILSGISGNQIHQATLTSYVEQDFLLGTMTSVVKEPNTNGISEESVRVLSAILSIMIFGKLMYFLQIIDEVAPLINIIIKIFYDIGWFIIIMFVIIFSFSTSFYIIARNQTDG